MMNVISLNVFSLTPHKLSLILSRISSFRPHIICLQETFTHCSLTSPSNFTVSQYRNIWPGQIYISKHLMTLISPSLSSSLLFLSSDHRIMDIKISHPTHSFFLRNIYAPADHQDNSLFWQSFPSLPPSPMFVCGDFNITTHTHDRWSSSPFPSNHNNPNLLTNLFPNLIDLASFSPSPLFTLFRNYSTYSSKSRIDFILASPSLLKPSHTSITFPINPLSDHRAVILKFANIPHSKHWHMNTKFLNKPYVVEQISSILSSYTPPSSPSSWDDCKHKIFLFYKQYTSSQSRKNKSAIINLSNRIAKLQNSPSPNYKLISKLSSILSSLQSKLSSSMAIRSRTRWYEHGEQSSSYFFRRFKTNYMNTSIDSLFIPSSSSPTPTLSSDPISILSHATSHFSNLWSNSQPLPLPSPLSTYIPKLTTSSISELDKPISPIEFFSAVNSKQDHSSPGPDGLPYKFYKSFLLPISHILIPIFHMIASGSPPPLSWLNGYTILLHKKNTDPHYVSNLRPISLTNTDLKILSTILANRFQSYASYLIHPDQTGFMRNRHIYDTILDINAFATLPSPPPQSFILSVDWSKAYDRVSHNWLDHVLTSSLFPPSFINLAHTSYHNKSLSLKINNLIGSQFPIHQGVPQGDPFSPLLFNLSIEPFFNLLRSIPTVHIRAYADDTNIFCTSLHDYNLLQSAFSLYFTSTGGQINISKSSLLPLSPSTFSPPPNSPPLTNSLNILGVIIPIDDVNTRSLWSSLSRKISSSISFLSDRNLSFRGRILVTKSLVLSKVYYHIPICPPPPYIISSIQSTINKFIWKSKTHPPFRTATLPISQGGLNFPDFHIECKIRHAKLLSRAFDPDPPFWIKSLNSFTILQFHKSIPYCIYN